MLKNSRLCPVLLLAVTSLFAAGGCKSYVVVSGTATFPANVKIAENDMVQIIFWPETKGEQTGVAVLSNKDKTFDCKQIAPGKYKVGAKIEPPPNEIQKRAAEFAEFNHAFDQKSTKLFFTVPSGSESIAIDFAKGTVTTKK